MSPITDSDLRLALVDALTRSGAERSLSLRDAAHCLTVLPACESAPAVLAAVRYARMILAREAPAVRDDSMDEWDASGRDCDGQRFDPLPSTGDGEPLPSHLLK